MAAGGGKLGEVHEQLSDEGLSKKLQRLPKHEEELFSGSESTKGEPLFNPSNAGKTGSNIFWLVEELEKLRGIGPLDS